jgi:peptidoglycan hydrolase-like protein with peptidoglycan-binding domain
MRAVQRGRRALLATLTLILTGGSLAVVTSLPAEAAYGVCDSASWRYAGGVGTDEYTKVPVHTGSGMYCYMGSQQGSKSAVMALQDAIQTCYWDTPAAEYIDQSGGVDGVYGEGTVKAVRWVQANRLGFTGSDVDGIYGPATRSAMKWPMYSQYSGGYTFRYTCKNPNEI